MNKPISLSTNQLEIQYLEAVLKTAKAEQSSLGAYLHEDQITLSQYEETKDKIAVDIAELEERITVLR